MTRIRRCYLFCAVILFALLLSPFLPAAQATETAGANASVQVKNRDYRDELFRCEAELSEANPHGQIAAFVCAETGQFKGIRFYPATSTVHVSLPNVKDTDYIKIVWLDKDCRPVAKPTIQRMERNKTVAYAQFSNALAELLNRTGGPEASDYDSGNPYALKRLIVECDESLDLNRWDASDIVRGPDGLCVLQFKSAEQAEQCAQSLRGLPSVRYAEPDRYIMADTASYSGEDTAELSDASARRYSWGADVAGIGKYVEDLIARSMAATKKRRHTPC